MPPAESAQHHARSATSPVAMATWLVLVSMVLASTAPGRVDPASAFGSRSGQSQTYRLFIAEQSGGQRATVVRSRQTRPDLGVLFSRSAVKRAPETDARPEAGSTPVSFTLCLIRQDLVALPPPSGV